MSGSGEYISREAFLEKERSLYCKDCSQRKNSKGKLVYEIGDAPCRACGIGDVLDDVEDFPAADVRHVVRGKWIGTHDGFYYSYSCSECSYEALYKENTKDQVCSEYCPNCGADMRGESDV